MSSPPIAAASSTDTLQHARDRSRHLGQLLRAEREAAAEFLVALAEFDGAKLWRELGYPNLFHFLHRELGLSAGTAHYRKVAAELIQRYPEILEPLRDGRLCLTAIVELARVITPENRDEVLPRFFHLSRREAQAVAAAIAPVANPPERDVVTAVRLEKAATAVVYLSTPGASRVVSSRAGAEAEPEEAPPPPQALPSDAGSADAVAPTPCSAASAEPPSPCAPPREVAVTAERTAPPIVRADAAEPLDAELSRLHVTVTREFLRKLEAARDALSHAKPGANMAEVLEAGLDLVLARQAKRRGATDRPRPGRASKDPDRVPAEVRRAAWQRSGGRCEWPLDSGGCCGSTTRLEFDHIVTRARGGRSTLANVRVLCAIHNAVAARRQFGDAWMDRFTRRGAGPPPRSPEQTTAPGP